MPFDFEKHRRANGSIDLFAAYCDYFKIERRDNEAMAIDFATMIDQMRPVNSRQVAAMCLAQMKMFPKAILNPEMKALRIRTEVVPMTKAQIDALLKPGTRDDA